jgi:Zn-dependent protease with chaperone function
VASDGGGAPVAGRARRAVRPRGDLVHTGFLPSFAGFFLGRLPSNLSSADPSLWLLLGLTALFLCAQYVYSRHRMRTIGGSPVADADLEARVFRLARQIDVPTPSVHVAGYTRPNSMIFRSKRSAKLVLTEGLLESAD